MSFSLTFSRAQQGINAPLVSVETHLSRGLPCMVIVGLPETAVKESKDRVRSAILNAKFDFPAKRITINLAPADLPKQSGRFDLPIALGILAASSQIKGNDLKQYEFAGELALDGKLRAIHGILPMALAAKKENRTLIVPQANAAEAALVEGLTVLPATSLLDVCAHLNNETKIDPYISQSSLKSQCYQHDMRDIKGQFQARRALEIAAAGRHNILFAGPPGTGKTMLASRLPGILPPMSTQESIETAAIHSIRGQHNIAKHFGVRPYRHPHHTASGVALVGGGATPKPGEISLAHHGVLFLDELPEFDRNVLEVLREPLESGMISISRASQQIDFPANFQLVAAMNPCPCGYAGMPDKECQTCEIKKRRYLGKLSGPLLDRIDMHVHVPALPKGALSNITDLPEDSETIQERVTIAYQKQIDRQGKSNQQLTSHEIDQLCSLKKSEQALLDQAVERLGLSARAYHRTLKVARTIADLASSENIEANHLTEALGYRPLWQSI